MPQTALQIYQLAASKSVRGVYKTTLKERAKDVLEDLRPAGFQTVGVSLVFLQGSRVVTTRGRPELERVDADRIESQELCMLIIVRNRLLKTKT